ncbi:hypothetical protein V6N13_031470 [Hibiscus sabdariffa]
MKRSSHKLSCEQLAFCFPLNIQLSNCRSRNIRNVGLLVGNSKDQRTYSSQSLFEPVSERLITGGQFLNQPSLRSSSESSCYKKFACAETHPILQSSSLQHWFKNWQEQRKHKLTASTFAGAVGFWPIRRTQLWLEKLGAIEPFSGNLATCWNNIKEEVALERYKLITGNSVDFPEFQRSIGDKMSIFRWRYE